MLVLNFKLSSQAVIIKHGADTFLMYIAHLPFYNTLYMIYVPGCNCMQSSPTYVLAVYILGHFFAVRKQTFYLYLSIISVPDPDPRYFFGSRFLLGPEDSGSGSLCSLYYELLSGERWVAN